MAPLHNPLVAPYAFPSTIPPLPNSDGLDPVVRASVRAEGSHSLELDGTTSSGAAVLIRLSCVASGVVRVELDPETGGRPTDGAGVRFARLAAEQVAWSVERHEPGQVRIVADNITVDVELEPVRLVFYGAYGRRLLAQDPRPTDVTDRLAAPTFGLSCADGRVIACHDTFACEPDEHFYGFGEKFTNFDKRGQWIEMWNYDTHGVNSERAYKNVPFFVSSRGYGVFVDSTTPVRFDMAASNHATWSVVVPDAALDYYIIAGADPMEVIRRYGDLVGKPILPPKWAFGLWVSSGFKADSTEATLARARELREHGILADVLHLDCYWQKWGCWSDLEWDTDVFPDPERMLRDIKALGLRVCLWINPYIGIQSDRFRQASERGWLLRTPGGEVYRLQLWGGYHPPVGILDLSHPEAVDWFVGRLRELLRMGADVFKTDFGEGIPADAIAHDGTTGERLHNAYTLVYNDLVADVTAAETGRAGLVWGRSTYAGGQRYAAQWAGDPNCTYQDLASTMRGGLSLGASGHPFWSHDIGGFHGQPTPDLYVRWAQFGLLSPLSRLHGMTTRLPWDYGEPALCAFRDMVRLRYRLLPYLFTCAFEAAATSQPIMRALGVVYPGDPALATVDLEYLLGPDLLVAPIYNAEGRRPVVFPPGQWVDVWSHEVIVGPTTRQIDVPLERVPLYARGNALLPTMEPVEHLEEAPWGLVTFDAYLLDRGQATLRDLDGETHISASFDGPRLDLRLRGAKSRVGLRLLPVAGHGVEEVRLNGTPLLKTAWTLQADGTITALLVAN